MPIFNKFTYCNMAKGGHKQKEVFTKYIYTKAIARKNTLRQDNFRKCSWCHHFSKRFQCVIKRQSNTNARIFRQNPYSKLF